jgi:DNA polymerase
MVSLASSAIPLTLLGGRKDGSWLRIALPSGRVVCYPGAAIVKGEITYMGVNPYSLKWQRLKTYGGKLVENVT